MSIKQHFFETKIEVYQSWLEQDKELLLLIPKVSCAEWAPGRPTHGQGEARGVAAVRAAPVRRAAADALRRGAEAAAGLQGLALARGPAAAHGALPTRAGHRRHPARGAPGDSSGSEDEEQGKLAALRRAEAAYGTRRSTK
ncbi:hypothetical protein ISF_02747 [Cordyceps fumosorosea ARSEF 2679]|uniref:Uncharacterized protein n=1 Tax=Cordyceps fumosorosea (strain ARSEF 2679) TaxID=1081104 RepID=A0A168B196_CORFA|nr:hypothetical protein ISF_02747 [Cordyceps fumosorosea ARSEF 2679]OAA69477.1 hypothetical protein ISF_02747 [Cordyceps fumosorosea ARSEF 2679]